MFPEVLSRLFRQASPIPREPSLEDQSIRELIPQIQTKHIKTGLDEVVYKEMNIYERRKLIIDLDRKFDLTRLIVIGPEWLSDMDFLTETLKLSSSQFWFNVVGSIDQSKAPLGSTISYGTTGSLIPTLVGLNLAAILGPDFSEIKRPQTKIYTPPTKVYESASTIAQNFDCASPNFEDAKDRLCFIYSENGLALRSIGQVRAFKGSEGYCPAARLSVTLFNCYGDLLSEPKYQDYLRSKIVKSNPREETYKFFKAVGQ